MTLCTLLQVAIRSGHMYSARLCAALRIQPEGVNGGVVRVSAVHYNSWDDVRRFCDALDGVL